MTLNKRSILVLVAASSLAIGLAATNSARADEADKPWLDRKRSPEERAELAVGAMTLDEKIGMLNGSFGSALLKDRPSDKRIGAGHVPGVPRLGIPELFESDASLGVANSGEMRKGDVATALPSSLSLGASFDPQLAYAGGAMIGSEARAKGFNVLLAGGANLVRDPWGGRAFEYLSEDVWLTGVLAGESIRGIQSNNIVSTIKHFALNPQESGRYVVDARMDESALRQSDLLAFEIAIERGNPGSVMCGYNKVNGDWDCENSFLLNDVLKRDWHYPGWVMSDWGAVHSTIKAAKSGLDQESGRELDREVYFGAPLKAAVTSASLPTSLVDEKVRRILRTMFAHGLIDDPAPGIPQAIDYEAHALVAQRAAEGGIVLLKNSQGVLPLAATARRIAVFGAHADVGVLSGGGSSQVRSVGGNAFEIPLAGAGPFSGLLRQTYHASSPLEAIRKRVGTAKVSFSDGTDLAGASREAAGADVAIVFAEQWRSEVLDVETLRLSDAQEALIAAVSKANKHTIVVLETGGPVTMPWLDKPAAVMEAWYPGQRGGEAIARVLFGEVNPSGKLPVTFPADRPQPPRADIPGLDQAKAEFKRITEMPPADLGSLDLTGNMKSFPVDYREGADAGYRWYGRTNLKPAFPFGFGLSYTHFSYSDLAYEPGLSPRVSFSIRNNGKVRGAEVGQVYALSLIHI